MMNFWNQMNFVGPFQSQREMNEPRHSFPPWFWIRGSLCPGSFLNDLRNVFRHRRSVTHHGSDIVADCPASIMPQIYYLRSVVSSFPVKAEIDWSPPSHYSVSICIILICNGCIPSWLRVTIDVLPPGATFNHMRCDYTLRLIEVLRPLQPLWYSRKIGTVLSATPSTSCRSIDHLTLLSCLVSHQAGLRVW